MESTYWAVVVAASAIIGLFISVGKPIITLNNTLTKLQMTLDELERKFNESQVTNTESHKRILDKNDEQDKELANHEARISNLEKNKGGNK